MYHRREVLSSAVAAGALGLAGCIGGEDDDGDDDGSGDDSDSGSGNGGSETDDGDDGSGDELVDQTFVYPIQSPPSEWDTLSVLADFGLHGGFEIFYDDYVYYHPAEQDFVPGVLDDWEIDAEKAVVHIDEDYRWSNGDPITANDLYVDFQLQRYIDGWQDHTDSVEVIDDQTFQVNLATKVNPFVFMAQTFQRRFADINEQQYGDALERLQDVAETDEEIEENEEELDAIIDELLGTEGNDPHQIDDPLTSGPFTIDMDGVRDNSFIGTYNEHYGRAENVNWTEVKGEFHGEDQTVWQGLRTGQLHGTTDLYYMPPDVVDSMPDEVLEVRKNSYTGLSIIPQTRDEWLGNWRVRQALFWVINREQVASNARPRLGEVVEVPHGIYTEAEYWLGDLIDDMTDYAPYESDHETATEILEDEGFTREDGDWYTPDGERWNVPIASATDTDWANVGQTVVENFRDFGIESDLNTASHATHWDDVFTTGDYDGFAVAWHWNGWPHPYYGFYYSMAAPWERQGHAWPNPVGSENEGEVEVPRVGDPDGPLETYNVDELVAEAEQVQDEEREREIYQTLGWIFNQSLVKLHCEIRTSQNFLHTEDWEVPSTDDPDYRVQDAAMFYLPRVGKLRAKQN